MNKQDKKELRQQIACEWLENNYLSFSSLRHDVITDRLQIRCADSTGERQERWRNLTDKDINTMVCNCVAEAQVNINVSEMWTALKSDMVPSVHPIRAWLDGLPPYTPDQPDWIDWLASQVRVKNNDNIDNLRGNQLPAALKENTPCRSRDVDSSGTLSKLSSNNNHSLSSPNNPADRLWRGCFKKWFVAMVASWMKDEVVNHTVLVLVGRQGIFKTTWLDYLIPPALREYSSKLPLSGQISKDDRLRLCENAMLNIDELDAICGREMNIVKSLLTSTDVNERAAYGRLKERRVRLASFCASTNNREFLTDITGNRRWLPFEVESIQNPFHSIIPYEQMYAQAWALAQDPFFSYWFDLDEIEVLEQHNQHFRDESNEEQLLDVYFAVPPTDATNAKFLTTAEISERLIYYGNIKKPMTLSRLGVLLSQKGFLSVRRGNPSRRGWIIYERESQEVNAERAILSKH